MTLRHDELAAHAALDLNDCKYVNLGVGLPTLVTNYVPRDFAVTFQPENGILGIGPYPEGDSADPDSLNASHVPATTLSGASSLTWRCRSP